MIDKGLVSIQIAYQIKSMISGVRVGQSYTIFSRSILTAMDPNALLLNSWGQWVKPILCLNALILLSLLN